MLFGVAISWTKSLRECVRDFGIYGELQPAFLSFSAFSVSLLCPLQMTKHKLRCRPFRWGEFMDEVFRENMIPCCFMKNSALTKIEWCKAFNFIRFGWRCWRCCWLILFSCCVDLHPGLRASGFGIRGRWTWPRGRRSENVSISCHPHKNESRILLRELEEFTCLRRWFFKSCWGGWRVRRNFGSEHCLRFFEMFTSFRDLLSSTEIPFWVQGHRKS